MGCEIGFNFELDCPNWADESCSDKKMHGHTVAHFAMDMYAGLSMRPAFFHKPHHTGQVAVPPVL